MSKLKQIWNLYTSKDAQEQGALTWIRWGTLFFLVGGVYFYFPRTVSYETQGRRRAEPQKVMLLGLCCVGFGFYQYLKTFKSNKTVKLELVGQDRRGSGERL